MTWRQQEKGPRAWAFKPMYNIYNSTIFGGESVVTSVLIHSRYSSYFAKNYATTVLRYSFRKGFSSSSALRFKGVHFGSSLNRRMALMYCETNVSCRSPKGRQRRPSQDHKKTHVAAIGSETVIDTCHALAPTLPQNTSPQTRQTTYQRA